MSKLIPESVDKLPIVTVVWHDASIRVDHEASLDDPESMKNFGGFVLCHDHGYLVHKTRKHVVLAVSVSPEDNAIRHAITIPSGWVREIWYYGSPTRIEATKEKKNGSSKSS